MTPRIPVALQNATPDQAALLTSIAHAAKRHWGYPESWIQSWSTQLTISPESIATRPTVVACVEGQVVGFHQLCTLGRTLRLDHLWIHPDFMRQGVGTVLFQDACRRGAGMGWSELKIVSDPNAAGFYERQGASRIGVERDGIDGQPRELPVLLVPLNRAG
jgi:GNAT superfamily N-acetyltransferase